MWTTSRYSSRENRALAQSLSLEFGATYVARGKKSLDELSKLARRLGEARINIITQSEGKGESSQIETAEVDELGNWGWFDEKIELKKKHD